MKVFDRIIRVGYWFCLLSMAFLVAVMSIEAFNKVSAQTITVNLPSGYMNDHMTVHEIMEQSNPSCYIEGRISHVRMENGRNGYRQLKDIEITPEYYIWEDLCQQFQHNHFTDFEVPKLHQWHIDTVVRVQYINANSNWHIHSVVPVLDR